MDQLYNRKTIDNAVELGGSQGNRLSIAEMSDSRKYILPHKDYLANTYSGVSTTFNPTYATFSIPRITEPNPAIFVRQYDPLSTDTTYGRINRRGFEGHAFK